MNYIKNFLIIWALIGVVIGLIYGLTILTGKFGLWIIIGLFAFVVTGLMAFMMTAYDEWNNL